MSRLLKHIFILGIITFVKVYGSGQSSYDCHDGLCTTNSGLMCDDDSYESSVGTFDMDDTGVLIIKPVPKAGVPFSSKMPFITSWIEESVIWDSHRANVARLPKLRYIPSEDQTESLSASMEELEPSNISIASVKGSESNLQPQSSNFRPPVIKFDRSCCYAIDDTDVTFLDERDGRINSWLSEHLGHLVEGSDDLRQFGLFHGIRNIPLIEEKTELMQDRLARMHYGLYFFELYYCLYISESDNVPDLQLRPNPEELMELAMNGGKEAQRLIALDYMHGGDCFEQNINALFEIAYEKQWPHARSLLEDMFKQNLLPRPTEPKWIAVYESLGSQFESGS